MGHPASVRVLEKAGFLSTGPATAEPGGSRFTLMGKASRSSELTS